MTKAIFSDLDPEFVKEIEHVKQPGKGSYISTKSLAGIIIVLLLAITSTIETQFANSMATQNFTAFTFAVWYGRNFTILLYPLYCLCGLITGKSIESMWSQDSLVLKEKDNYKKGFIKKVLPITVIYNASYYFYYYALEISPASDCAAVMSVNIVLIYVLSIYWLNEPFLVLRMLAVVMAIAGVLFFAYSYGLHGSSMLGIFYSLCVAILTAVYRVYLKVVLPDATIGQASLLLSVASVIIIATTWPFIIWTNVTGLEIIEWETMPWKFLNITSIFSLLVSALIFFGTAITIPIFVAIGMLLGIPGNALVDLLYREIALDSFKFAGIFLIFFSFIILLIPIEKARHFSRWILPCGYKNNGL